MGFTSGTESGWLRLPTPDLSPFAREIRESAARYGVEEALIKAVIRVESGFNSRAVSPKGARGLMQLMPGTANMLGVRDSFDPRQNIDGGVRHLRGLIDRFGSDLKLALAAYNAGEQAVVNHGGIPPYRETRDYVTRILGLFAPAPAVAAPPVPAPREPEMQSTYRTVGPDGTITYTNIPPSGKL
jgi:soluble lytic murein transglycosylase-like protein